ncbi:hypothetical protein HUB98_05815 [Paenibacillus barcinonensis]|uniref:Uncharacterized protein n=1 Tax=Paenibacillus barcinonensis TaxID=198119 RepID=A0A2V4VEL5_PAEBA|nr:hypothetical protein [Paenibacillus barcinonensis]PYE51514.1 hypothetical protein DFQ00_102308 [Paenibacillus barcinonensis]QKS55897.1 hypothetical protein HUB98_05815 [Paenibacillus barcinonensis]
MRNFNEEIQTKNAEVEGLKVELKKIQGIFKEKLISFFRDLYNTESKKLVIEHAEKAAELGEEKLRLLKKDVQTLVSNVSDVVEKHIEKEVLWWHLKENSHTYTHYSEHRIPEFLDEECRYIYGELGTIFANHKMITVHDSEYGAARGIDNNFNRKGGKVRFSYGFELSKDIKEELNHYSEVHKKAISLRKEIEKIKQEQMKERIGDVWDSL